MSLLSAYALLISSAFLSATLLPGSSEAVLLGLLASATGNPWALVLVATLGNVAGSIVNWILGLYAERFKDRRWFPLKAVTNPRAQAWFGKYGVWALLFAWVPLIGDALTVLAGVFRVPLRYFLPLVAIGKTLRYCFIVIVWQWGVA